MITILAHVNANKFESCQTKVAFANVQRKIIGLADLQLASHICKSMTDLISPAHNIINDDFCVSILIDWNTTLLGLFLPDAVTVMDEINEGCWPISCQVVKNNDTVSSV